MKMQIYKEDSSMPKWKSVSGALKDLKWRKTGQLKRF